MPDSSTNQPTAGNVDVPFTIPAIHRLRFTDDLFGEDRQVLIDLLQASGDQPARAQFWLDEDVDRANPWLRGAIDEVVSQHPKQVRRVSRFQVVPGGEASKNDIHILERMLKVMNAANLDRRSYVVVIGGGATLDAVVSPLPSPTVVFGLSAFRRRRWPRPIQGGSQKRGQPVREEELGREFRSSLGRDQ